MKKTGHTTNVRLDNLKLKRTTDKKWWLSALKLVLEDRDGFCKTALKGLNKADIGNPLKKCKEVLHTGKTDVGVNKGFRVRDNTLFTYEQRRAGIGNFYCKRELVDAVHTKPLDIVLCPWEEHQCVEITDHFISCLPFYF